MALVLPSLRCAIGLLASLLLLAPPAWGEMTPEELARATQNPVADLISVPFQNNINFGVGPKDNVQNILNIQPVIPIDAGDRFNVITRTILPIVSNPTIEPGDTRKSGLGDTDLYCLAIPEGRRRLRVGNRTDH